MTATDPRPALAAMPAASQRPPPKPSSRHARPYIVMPGLVPGIHSRRRHGPDGDARNKSGHDEKGEAQEVRGLPVAGGPHDKNMTIHDIPAGVHASNRRPGPRSAAHVVIPDPIRDHDSRHRRSRWRAGSTAETAARTRAGPRIGADAPSGVTEGRVRCEATESGCVNPVARQAGGERNGTPPDTPEFRAWRERRRRREARESPVAGGRLRQKHDNS